MALTLMYTQKQKDNVEIIPLEKFTPLVTAGMSRYSVHMYQFSFS